MSTLSQTPIASPLPAPAPPTSIRASIADRVARSFPPLACVRGFRYFARKRVDLVHVSEKAVDADVKGKRTLRVTLRVEEGRLASACTCAATELGPAACRHVWATLLEIDRRGAFETLRTTGRTLPLGMVEKAKPSVRPARASGPRKGKAPARTRGATGGGT